MLHAVVKTLRITGDSDAALSGIHYIHGIICNTSSLTAVASAVLSDALTTAGASILTVHANTADGTNYESTFGVVLPYPIKVTTGLSVDITNLTDAFVVYS